MVWPGLQHGGVGHAEGGPQEADIISPDCDLETDIRMMGARHVIDAIVSFEKFRNIDLVQQGYYRVSVSL